MSKGAEIQKKQITANKYNKQRYKPSDFPNAGATSRPETAKEREDRIGSKRYSGDRVVDPNSKTQEVDIFAKSATAANEMAAKRRGQGDNSKTTKMKTGGRLRMDGTATPR